MFQTLKALGDIVDGVVATPLKIIAEPLKELSDYVDEALEEGREERRRARRTKSKP